MNFRPDKEYEKRGDIVFLSEIITNSMYWQVIPFFNLINFTKKNVSIYDTLTFKIP